MVAPEPVSYTQPQPQLTATAARPKVISIVSALIFLIAAVYAVSAVGMLVGIFVMIERSVGARALAFSVLNYFPTLGFVPVLFSCVAFLFFYLAFKIRSGSRVSLWLSVLALVVVPTLAALSSQLLLLPFVQVAASFGSSGAGVPALPLNFSTFRFGMPIFVLAGICVIVLATSARHFRFSNDPITPKAKVFLALVALTLAGSTVVILALGYSKAQDTDFGYTQAQTIAGYHIYKPGSVPRGLSYATRFIVGKELAGKQTAVQVAYDVPFRDLMQGGQSKPIVVKQVNVTSDFNPKVFAASLGTGSVPQNISIANAVDQTGFLVQKPLGNLTLSTLVYVTHDNILVTLVSPKALPEELVRLAESLE
jgi:hypothetical protein